MFDLNETIPQKVFVAAKKRIEEQLLWFLEHLKDLDSISSLKVKLSADGTNVGGNFKIVNFTFTILNEGDRAKASSGNYTLGLSKLPYIRLEEPFKYLLEQIKDFTQLEFKNRKFDVKFYFCSDWKLTATALGLNAATSGPRLERTDSRTTNEYNWKKN
ncbi:hypothetical protein BpHYR1_033764 [Brachionus plicatilis]|uniref:Uncharacterized protein n=1 Tax=Brachionus plicatilis TaxID=10195 RepID=A0A3M7PJY2_BRAPC|nr:hypothetical protein BpHYR1_033764 [Brachionus plicatilis]